MPEFERAMPHVLVRLNDGRVLEARILNTDYLRWDRTRAKHGWPVANEALWQWQTFLAWSALRREGQIADTVTWEDFSERLCEQAEMQRPDGSQNGLDPTLSATQEIAMPGPSSPSPS